MVKYLLIKAIFLKHYFTNIIEGIFAMYLQDNNTRISNFFGFDWLFRLSEEEHYRPVQLPHDWSVEYPYDENSPTCGSGGYVKAGIGWYKKQFKVDSSAKGKKVFLLFDGAYMCTTVWLNGIELGHHAYGYTPFEFDVTDYIHYDKENEIEVKVDNSQQPNSRWYSGSGITRDVWMWAANDAYIPTNGTFIRTEKELVKISTKIESAKIETFQQKSIRLTTEILDHKGIVCEKTEIKISCPGEYDQEISLKNPQLWSDKNPYLYKAVSTITSDDHEERTVIDKYETTFGIRTVEFDPDRGCLINGEKVKLNGVCLHHDGGAVGAAVPKKLWHRRLLLLKEMGCNAIRTAHNPPDTNLLDLCDELGFYVMDEAFDEWRQIKWKAAGSNTHESRGYSEWFNDNYIADIEAMLYRDRNHPSVIMWSTGNEVPEQTMEDGHLLAKELQDICHRIDPTRLCTQGNDQIFAEPKPATSDFLQILDIVGYNYTGRWRSRAETLYYDDKAVNPNWIQLGTENPAAAGIRGDYRMDIPVSPWQRSYFAAPVYAGKLLRYTMTHDFVAGDFMWTGIDHLGESHWPNRSSSSGPIDTCGFPKDHYYFYKSIWNRKDPMVYIFPHRNLDEAKGNVLPVLCYTNCTYVELFVNGKSYGKKATSYPLYGMTETYGHFDTPPIAANTDDLFLSWDVPFEGGNMEAVGYINDKEVCRFKVQSAGKPTKMKVSIDADDNILQADGRDIAHIVVTFEDENGIQNPIASNVVNIKVDGPAELIGIDNGKPDCHESFKKNTKTAFNGMILGIIRTKQEKGEITITISSDELEPVVLKIACV